MGNLLLIVCVSGALSSAAGQLWGDKSTLKSVQVIFRHGKKSADESLESRSGLLTDIGKDEMYQLGKFIRSRYAGFIKIGYDPAEMEIISSASNRCIQSGALFAYGLYEVYNLRANWSSEGNIPFEPIPVQSIPEKFDKYLQLKAACPRKDLLKGELQEKFSLKVFENNKDFVDAYVQATGDATLYNTSLNPIERIQSLFKYVDPSVQESTAQWSQPFLDRDIYGQLKYEYNEGIYASPELQPLEIGPYLAMLYSRMTVTPGTGFKNMYAYSTHDFSISALVYFFTEDLRSYPADPPTGSTFMLEIHQKKPEDEPFLEVYYRDGDSKVVKKITDIPGCSPVCYISKFGLKIKDIVPTNYEDSCKLGGANVLPRNDLIPESSEGRSDAVPLAIITGMIIVGLAIAAALTYYAKKKRQYVQVL